MVSNLLPGPTPANAEAGAFNARAPQLLHGMRETLQLLNGDSPYR